MSLKPSTLFSLDADSLILLKHLLKQFQPYSRDYPYILKRSNDYWYYCQRLARQLTKRPSYERHLLLHLHTLSMNTFDKKKLKVIEHDLKVLIQQVEQKTATNTPSISWKRVFKTALVFSTVLLGSLAVLD